MTNKVYEIKRADMLNIKEYAVWKHANEEVWEVSDENNLLGADTLEMVELKRVMEFDYNGSHFRIFRKEGDLFGKSESWNYESFVKTVSVAYHRFSENDFVHITFKDSDTDVTPAATLLKGWNWVENLDGSGYLESPNGKSYFQYEVQYADKCERIVYHGLHNNVSVYHVNPDDIHYKALLQKFKSYAEGQVYVKVIKPLSKSLIKAVKNNNADEVLELIEAGADVNYIDSFGTTTLHWATNHADSHIIELLVEHGADVNHSDRRGMTKLMQESSYGNVAIVKFLLEHGAKRNVKDNSGRTAADYVKECLNCDNVSEQRTEDFKEIISLLESTSNEPAKYKFGNAVLPCNELRDFETEDTSVSIPCRIYLTQAPIEQYERAMKEVDGEFYSPYNFFIEGVAMKNKPDDELVIKKWMLLYALENGHVHKFGYVNDVPDTTWDYFKEQMAIGKKTFELCVTWEMCGKVKVKANSLEEAMDIFNNTSDYIKLPEGQYVDGSFQLSTTDPDEMASMTNQILK